MDALDRLKDAISALKKNDEYLTSEGISRKLGYKTGAYVSDIVGGSKPINHIFLEKLQREYSINAHWILTGDGEMFIDLNLIQEPAPDYKRKRKSKINEWPGVPVFDIPLTGSNGSKPTGHVSIPFFKDCALGIQASGDTMNPMVRSGDFVLCKEVDIDEIIMGDAYLILTHKGAEVIRYVHPHKTKSDHVLLVSDNQDIPSTELPRSAIQKIYKVRGVIRPY